MTYFWRPNIIIWVYVLQKLDAASEKNEIYYINKNITLPKY